VRTLARWPWIAVGGPGRRDGARAG
jgi:hypothetical protein